MPTSDHDGEAGLTMVEMLLVLAIVSLAATLVLGRGQPGEAILRLAVIESYLRDMRSEAMQRGDAVVVRVGGGGLQADGLPDLAVPPGSVFRAVPEAILFAPDGSSPGGRITVTPAEGAVYGVSIAPVTGAISGFR